MCSATPKMLTETHLKIATAANSHIALAPDSQSTATTPDNSLPHVLLAYAIQYHTLQCGRGSEAIAHCASDREKSNCYLCVLYEMPLKTINCATTLRRVYPTPSKRPSAH